MRAQVGVVVLLSALLVAPALQAQSRGFARAQTHGVPGSVTSFGFGGSKSFTPGVPASVTSQGFGAGTSCGSGILISSAMGCPNPFFQSTIINGQVRLGPFNNRRHRHHGVPVFSPYAYPIYGYGGYYPGYYDTGNQAPGYEQQPDDQPPVQVIVMPAQPAPPAPAASSSYASPQPQREPEAGPEETSSAPDIAPTLLVFKDGHQQEVRNYAIVGQTLYVLEAFSSHKIPLADLDLKATVKANDDRGLEFVLPATMKN